MMLPLGKLSDLSWIVGHPGGAGELLGVGKDPSHIGSGVRNLPTLKKGGDIYLHPIGSTWKCEI